MVLLVRCIDRFVGRDVGASAGKVCPHLIRLLIKKEYEVLWAKADIASSDGFKGFCWGRLSGLEFLHINHVGDFVDVDDAIANFDQLACIHTLKSSVKVWREGHRQGATMPRV